MIIISNKPGQLGNLLFIYANVLAYGLENNIKILNPAFYNYQSYFEGTKKHSKIIYKLFYFVSYYSARIICKLNIKFPLVYAKSTTWNEIVDLDMPNQFPNKLCFIQGWLYRSDKLLLKHKDSIKIFFIPTLKLNVQINSFIKTNFDLSTETIIAIHIRRGDYKTFKNGMYYYSINEYSHIIDTIIKLFEAKNVHFLICTNEKINLNELNPNNHKLTLAPNHELLDMYCMTHCNYIVGPPSTYTMWASFYGNVPLYKIEDKNKQINSNDFKIQL